MRQQQRPTAEVLVGIVAHGSDRPERMPRLPSTSPNGSRRRHYSSRTAPSADVKIRLTAIQLRRTTPKNMEAAGRLSGLLIQAHRELGQEHVKRERRDHLQRTLPADERRELLKDLRLAPARMHPIFRHLAEENA